MVLESRVERRIVKELRLRGCWVFKLHDKGAPDRLVMPPGDAKPFFIEFKRPGGKPRAEQEYYHERLRASGFAVLVIDSIIEGTRQALAEMYRGTNGNP